MGHDSDQAGKPAHHQRLFRVEETTSETESDAQQRQRRRTLHIHTSMRISLALVLIAAPRARPAKGIVTCSPAPCPAANKTVAVRVTGVSAGVRNEQLPAMRSFLQDASTGRWSRVVVLDVGSNNGNWSRSISQLCHQHRGALCEIAMFEPQPVFASRLTALVEEMGGSSTARFEAAAAWHTDSTLTFFLSKNTEASSMHSSMASKAGRRPRPTKVRALDLARYMRDALRLPRSDRDVLTLMKIDVESAEYELLPHLIAERALCGVRYLHIEWHLDALPAERRLAGLGLMLSLHHQLRLSCSGTGATPPVLVVREESPNNNGLQVPGLQVLAEQHSADANSDLAKAWRRGHARDRKDRAPSTSRLRKPSRHVRATDRGWFG